MAMEAGSAPPARRADRLPPCSEDAERGVLGSILLDASRVMDQAIAAQLNSDSFYVPAHRVVYETMLEMVAQSTVIDILTVTERLQTLGRLDGIGGATALERLVDSTPTAAHADYYIDLVRQKHLLRSIIACARSAEQECYETADTADQVLGRTEQAFLSITEGQHGTMVAWPEAVKSTWEHIERILSMHRGLTGLSSGFLNLDQKMQGLRPGEMIVLAARPSMGKTSLAMNIAENVSLGKSDPDRHPHPVGEAKKT